MIRKCIHLFTIIVLAVSFLWAILPMVILRENYVFAIHDGLDSYGGLVQNIYENKLYFQLDKAMPFMNGLEGKYTFITYNLYDFFNCMFGFINGQILTRIVGVFLGFFSLRHLLRMMTAECNEFQKDMISLLSAAYAITPAAPNRMIGFASLPAVVILFLQLAKKEKLSKYIWFGLLIPVFSIFDAVLIFVIGIWFLCAVILQIVKKHVNWNLNLTFVTICISTVIVNWCFFIVSLSAEDTNRGVAYGDTVFSFNWQLLKSYLLDGQYHSTALQRKILVPFLAIGTVYIFYLVCRKADKQRNNQKLGWILFGFWSYWIITAMVETAQESGLRTGILLIDGFQWGRAIGLMRIGWYMMFAAVMFMTDSRWVWRPVMYGVICFQLLHIASADTMYNDSYHSIRMCAVEMIHGDSGYVTYRDFYSENLFDEIKRDIDYDHEAVAAYGYHPSVLLHSNFNTTDGYESVHSMKWQLQFREIIAPELDLNGYFRDYYDGWGGRMYLFGTLDYKPTKDKNVGPHSLHINTEAFKKYGGKYILSRAPLSNADELNLEFMNDYESQESIYHIYLYKAM